jgi:hypothetical protein
VTPGGLLARFRAVSPLTGETPLQGTLSGRAYTDDARRMADTMNLHAVVKSRGWAVFALADGKSDNTAYETRDDAVRSTRWDRDNYLYLQIPAGGVNDPAEMQACLDYARALNKAGYRLPDPRDLHSPDRDFPVHQPPVMRADWRRQILNLAKPR